MRGDRLTKGIGKPRQPRAFAIEHRRESGGQKKAKLAFAAEGDRIGRNELLVAIARMTHDKVAAARRAKIAGEIGGEIMAWVEGRKSRKSLVGDVTLRESLACKAAREPGNPKRFWQFDTAPQNAPRTIGAIAQPDLSRKSFFF